MALKKHWLLGSASGVHAVASASLHPQRHPHSRHQPTANTSFAIELPQTLSKGERGGVIGHASHILPGADGNPFDSNYQFTGRGNDESVIKVALLFVDKVNKPRNRFIGSEEDTDDDITGVGLGVRSEISFSTNPTYGQLSSQAWETYKALDQREPGIWSLWPQRENQIIPEGLLSPDLAFQLELTNGLIVPDASTPFEDVLSFKERHKDELVALRHHLEDFAIRLSKEGDPKAVHLERERFDVSLAEYLTKARQSNIRKAVASLTTELDWAAAVRSITGGGSGGLIAAAQGLSLTAAAAAIGGGILAGLSIKSVAGLKEGPSPFRYIARIEREYGG